MKKTTTFTVGIVKTEEDSHFNDKPGVVGGNPRIEEIIDSDGVKIICYLSKNTRFKSEWRALRAYLIEMNTELSTS